MKPGTSTRSSLERIEAVLRDHGVIVFATPTAGVRLATDRPELLVWRHEKAICLQAMAPDLPSDFDYSAKKNGAIDGAPCGRRQILR
jgi:hypothetical protein